MINFTRDDMITTRIIVRICRGASAIEALRAEVGVELVAAINATEEAISAAVISACDDLMAKAKGVA